MSKQLISVSPEVDQSTVAPKGKSKPARSGVQNLKKIKNVVPTLKEVKQLSF